MIGFSATLEGTQEVPPNASTATGFGTFKFDGVNKLFIHVEFSGLGSAQTAAHIHGPAAVGFNASVVFPFVVGSPIDAVWVMPAARIADLNNGLLYVNIHSQIFPGGEIRGQIQLDATPTRPTTWGKIKALYRP
jgi:hypothetical protein